MNERFDDMIRKRLQSHESDVPDGLFDAISQRTDVQDTFFDNAIRSKIDAAESAVPGHLFDTISNAAELEHLSFDSVIRGKTENASSAVPVDMWQRIVAKKDRRRRPLAWWWVAATVLLLLAGGRTFYLLKPNPAEQSVTNTETKGSGLDILVSPQKRADEAATVNERKENGANEPDSTGTAGHSREKNLTGPGIVADRNIQLIPYSEPSKNATVRSGTVKGYPEMMADNTGTTLSDEVLPGFPLSSGQTTDEAIIHLKALSLLRNTSRFVPGQLLQAKAHAPVIPCPAGSGDIRNDWYVDVYGSAFLLQKKVQDQYLGKNAKAGFDSTLHQQVSFNAGISLVKNLGENFLLKTGLQYNRINESFRLTQVNERRLVTTISVRTVVIAPGDTVRIRDTSTTEQVGTAQYHTQNHYTQWDVPIIIGYEFGGENLQLNANAGIITNIRSSYQGEMLADSTRKIFDINNYHGQPVYRKSVGFSLYAGLSFVKALSGKTSLIVEPYTRIGLSNVTNSQAWFNQKNSMMGLNIGLRYKLNGGRQHIY